jgi:hypothetical protein
MNTPSWASTIAFPGLRWRHDARSQLLGPCPIGSPPREPHIPS